MKKKIIIYTLIVAAAAVLVYFLFIKSKNQVEKFTITQIKKGNITTTITSTGTLNPVNSIDVGTQVSGKIAKLFVDFNSYVKKGQLLAIIDTTALSLTVHTAHANLLKAQSGFELAKTQYAQDLTLYKKGYFAELDLITAKSTLEADSADVESAKVALLTAKTNLGYAYIYSPVTGTVTNRNVEEGNTVAASLQTPVLFSIAPDLTQMQILASVDESDIGQIQNGQTCDFTVQAYPDAKFYGTVVQIRLNYQVVSNVVNYTVVINADNKTKQLLPGMTATVDFHVQQRNNVLMVPNEALGFQPTPQMLAKYKSAVQQNSGTSKDSVYFISQHQSSRQTSSDTTKHHLKNPNAAIVWSLDSNGNLKRNYIILGITDGKNTEIVRTKDLKEGSEIILGMESSGGKTRTAQAGFPRGFGRGL